MPIFRRHVLGALVAASLGVTGLSAHAQSQGQTMTVASWGGALDKVYAKAFAGFEQKFGVTIKWVPGTTSENAAKVLAASSPAGPAPTTATCLGAMVGRSASSISGGVVSLGLLSQPIARLELMVFQHVLQETQYRMSRANPFFALLGQFGSTINERPKPTNSTW